MRENGGEMPFMCLESQTLAKKRFSFKPSLLNRSHCLATITFILDIYLGWQVLWLFNWNSMEP